MRDTRPYTYRCGICSTSWPYSATYDVCPRCDEGCKALKLLEPDHIADILTYDEARAQVLEIRGEEPPKAKRRIPIGRQPTKDELRRLDDALEAWEHKAPWWVR